MPHALVDAFQATLREATQADLLLHVIDASHAEVATQIRAVEDVLQQIEAQNIPQLKIYNKIDLAGLESRVEHNQEGVPESVYLSAITGDGLNNHFLNQAVLDTLRSYGWPLEKPEWFQA